eukprot:4202852-Karenia_brevis.AAC.1
MPKQPCLPAVHWNSWHANPAGSAWMPQSPHCRSCDTRSHIAKEMRFTCYNCNRTRRCNFAAASLD